jgi:hypothetical protein
VIGRGETIEYFVSPVYATNDPTAVVPKGLIIHATGNRGMTGRVWGSGSHSGLVSTGSAAVGGSRSRRAS